jgi:hypothetical protein
MRLVAHDADAEMHFAGMRLGTGGDGVEARVQLAQQRDKLRRCEPCERMGEEKIYHLAPMKVLLKSSLIRGREEIFEFRALGAFGNGFEQSARRLRDAVVPQQRVAKGGLRIVRSLHRFFAIATERGENVADECGAVRGNHPERIARFVAQAGILE